MSATHASLLSSMMWNLQEINGLTKTMKAYVGDADCYSWRHPLMTCSEMNVQQLLEDSKDRDRYTYLLELIIDRLIYFFNLMLKHLENNDVLIRFRPGNNVERPKNLSIVSLLHMIWDRLREQHSKGKETKPEKAKTLTEKVKISTSCSYTQSELSTTTTCHACELAQNLITRIVLKIETIFLGSDSSSAILMERNLIKEKLFSMSNWSAMTKWVDAILKDLCTICDEAEKLRADNKMLKNRIDSSESILAVKLKKHEDDLKISQRFLRENEEMARYFEREAKFLREEMQKRQDDFGVKIEELKHKNLDLMKHMTELKAEKKLIEEKLNNMDKEEEEKNNEWKTKFEAETRLKDRLQGEIEKIRDCFAKFKTDSENQIAESNLKCEELENKMRILKEDNTRLLGSLNEKQEAIDDSARKFLEAFPDISELDNTAKYKGTGDPMTDMQHQIAANKLRINQLLLQNENLTDTIRRIEAIRK